MLSGIAQTILLHQSPPLLGLPPLLGVWGGQRAVVHVLKTRRMSQGWHTGEMLQRKIYILSSAFWYQWQWTDIPEGEALKQFGPVEGGRGWNEMIFKALSAQIILWFSGQVHCHRQLLPKGTSKVENSFLTLPRGECLFGSALIPNLETALFEEMRCRDSCADNKSQKQFTLNSPKIWTQSCSTISSGQR